MPELNEIIEACKGGNRLAQRQLYELYKGKMFAMCLRYAGSREDAEDMLQDGFVQVFKDLHQFRFQGSFEGWMRRVVLNAVLQSLRRKKSLIQTGPLDQWHETEYTEDDTSDLFTEDMVKIVLHFMQQMPAGFRTVLNLYVLEGFTHEQIGQILGISAGTSKSQLSRAKACLKAMLEKRLTS